MTPEKAPESFGTFEKRAPGLNEARTHDPEIALHCSTNYTIKPTGNFVKNILTRTSLTLRLPSLVKTGIKHKKMKTVRQCLSI